MKPIPMPYGFRVEAADEAVPKARQRILSVVRRWTVPLSDEALSDVALMSSEVITNAVRHTGASCAVVVRWTGARLRVEVTDVDQRRPEARKVTLDAESGRGLLIVESLAAAWGSVPVTAGKVVWFEVGQASPCTGTRRLTALVRAAMPLSTTHDDVRPANSALRRTSAPSMRGDHGARETCDLVAVSGRVHP